MRRLLSMVLVSLCAGCAGREINPDAATQLASPSHCPWSSPPFTMTDNDCPLEPQRAFPRQEDRTGAPLPKVSSEPLAGLPH